MKYEWEDQITDEILWQIDAILPNGISLVGIAVEATESCEGALVSLGGLVHGIEGADVWKDILGDAQRHYEAQLEGISPSAS